jgi:energy-converting hydrogenase A subunit M
VGIKSRGNFAIQMCLRQKKVRQCWYMDCFDDCEKEEAEAGKRIQRDVADDQ